VGQQLLEGVSERFISIPFESVFFSSLCEHPEHFYIFHNSASLAVKYRTVNSRKKVLLCWLVTQFQPQNLSVQTCYRVGFGFSPIPKFYITGLEEAFVP
jgi:hypothetical protein